MEELRTHWLMRLIGAIALAYLIWLNVAKGAVPEHKIDQYCNYYKYDNCELVKSIIWHETNFNEMGFNPEKTGSYGLMQIQCSTAKMVGLKYGCDQLFDPQVNVRFGIKYLEYIQRIHKIQDTRDLVAAYNAGSPIVCNNKNYDSKGKLLCYPGEYINHAYLFGPRGVMREYSHRLRDRLETEHAAVMIEQAFTNMKKEKLQ